MKSAAWLWWAVKRLLLVLLWGAGSIVGLLLAAAAVSYVVTSGEFDNRSLHDEAATCATFTFPDPKADQPDLPEYSDDPATLLLITAARYRTMEAFSRYAAMIWNTYSSAGPEASPEATIATFDYKPRFLAPVDDEIQWIDRVAQGDLTADIYHGRETEGFLDVYVGYEGTNWSEGGDVLANFAWFMGFLGSSELDGARAIFEGARDQARSVGEAEKRVPRFITFGHSLGGALAQHVAFGYPCVSAIVLDASFVVSRHSFTAPFPAPYIVHLGDRGDAFTALRERQRLDDIGSRFVRFIGWPFEGFMPGGNTKFYTINATDVESGPPGFRELISEQHRPDVYVGTMLDMYLEYDWWSGSAEFPPFRLRCLSRVVGMSPEQCKQSEVCDRNDALRDAKGRETFVEMCKSKAVPPSGAEAYRPAP